MNRYRQIIGRINYWLFLTVIALLPAPQLVLRYACVAWIIMWFLEGRWMNISYLRSQLSNRTFALPFLLFGAWFVWKLLSGLWAADSVAWKWQMERYLTFILLVPVGLWGVNECYDWRTAGKVLVTACMIALPAYVGCMTILFYHPEWVPTSFHDHGWIQYQEWWIFFSDNISHLKHRLFLCSVELFGAIIAFLLYRKRLRILLPLWAVMLSSIPLTTSRQAVLTAVGLFFIGIICILPSVKRWRYSGIIVLVGVAVGAGLLYLHPRMQEVELSNIKEMRELSYYHDVRFNIWGAALQHPQDYIAHGLGAGQSCNYLIEKYKAVRFDGYVAQQYHAHCQYLEELMEIGLPGLLFFLLAWISIPLYASKKGRLTAILFTTLFALNMFTDCMFGRFDGIALWAVGLLFILLQSDPQRDEQTAGDT